eukprot:Pgem_evm1s2089
MGKTGKCSHVGGLLMLLYYHWRWRKDPERYKTCTDIRCQFNIPGDGKKEARAIPIKDWDIVKQAFRVVSAF